MTTKNGFTGIYKPMPPDKTRAHYDQWSGTYDQELSENGYATPARCADALAAVQTPVSARILDFGCGTGVSGTALAARGFTNLDGCDLSIQMMKIAQSKGLYQRLWQIEACEALPKGYDVIAAVGVISTGAAPPDTLDIIMNALNIGGRVVFSFNDHALADPRFPAKLQSHIADGARLIFDEYGPHLPGIGLKSSVYILEKT